MTVDLYRTSRVTCKTVYTLRVKNEIVYTIVNGNKWALGRC
jgi:hypothetical protein